MNIINQRETYSNARSVLNFILRPIGTPYLHPLSDLIVCQSRRSLQIDTTNRHWLISVSQRKPMSIYRKQDTKDRDNSYLLIMPPNTHLQVMHLNLDKLTIIYLTKVLSRYHQREKLDKTCT